MGGSVNDLAAYRYNRALEELENAEHMLFSGRYKLALNRSYYAIFHAIRAVNTLDNFDSRKHSGVIAHFNQYHVKTGHFPKGTHTIIQSSYELREHADYEDFFIASIKDANMQVKNASVFLGYVSDYLNSKNVLWCLVKILVKKGVDNKSTSF